MSKIKLEKNQTGIACEFYVAGELSRLGYNVTVTFGNTKSIDLLVSKNEETFAVQVKGIQSTASICWNLDKTKLQDKKIVMVLVNLHVDNPSAKPDFFVLTQPEALKLFKDTPKEGQKRTYLDYNTIKRLNIYESRWDVFEKQTNALLKGK